MNLSSKIFSLIQGTWKITRKIPGTGFLNGYAIFDQNPNDPHELFYSENGIFVFENGKSLEASKKYVYRLIDEDIYVYFNEKSSSSSTSSFSSSSSEETTITNSQTNTPDLCYYPLFHRFNISNHAYLPDQRQFQFKALHLCIDDKYNVRYEFNLDKPDEFLIVYDVNGPAKKYLSETVFQKKAMESIGGKLF